MTTLYSVSSNDVVNAADVNQYKSMLEGASGYTSTYKLQATANTNLVLKLGDAAGGYKLSIQDSAGTEVGYLDSDGNLVINGSFTPGTLQLPTLASPSQTTEGSISWDTDDDRLTVGTGSATKVIGLSRGAGSNASATQELMYDTTAAALKVWDGSTSQTVGTDTSFNNTRLAFRANRRLVAEYSAAKPDSRVSSTTPAVLLSDPAGIGFYAAYVAGDTIAAVSGEPVASFGSGGSVTRGGIGSFGPTGDGDHSMIAVLAPNTSPRMLCRVDLPAASANLTVWLAGFFAVAAGATDNGAYLRITTTGNTFFVTRQGGVETTTDLGALSRTTVLGFEIETADAGVTWVCRNQAGTVLATHTTNVPTAATALAYGIVSSTAAAVPHGVAYCRIEGTFA